MSTVTVSSKCHAKDPSTCRFHGHALQNQASALQDKINNLLASPVKKEPAILSSGVLVSKALESNLNYDGPKPKWWKKYAKDLAADSELPTQAKLLDVIDSPVGPLAVVWQEESVSQKDRGVSLDSGMGVHVCYLKSMETGEDYGYVKMAYTNDATFERSFGSDEFTPWRYRERYGGTGYQFRYGEGKNVIDPVERRRIVWACAHRDFNVGIRKENGEYVSSYNVTEKDAPSDDTQFEAEVDKLMNQHVKPAMDDMRQYFATPFVDYSHVNDSLKGKGYGSALYVYTARVLGERGQVLRGSGIQSDDAQSAWGRFASKIPTHVSKMKLEYHDDVKEYPILDFRK